MWPGNWAMKEEEAHDQYHFPVAFLSSAAVCCVITRGHFLPAHVNYSSPLCSQAQFHSSHPHLTGGNKLNSGSFFG